MQESQWGQVMSTFTSGRNLMQSSWNPRPCTAEGGGGVRWWTAFHADKCISEATRFRSYTFSRKESVPERTIKCFGKVRESVAAGRKETAEVLMRLRRRRKRRCAVVRRVKEFSRAALFTIFRRLLFCTTTVDVAVV